MIRQSKVVPYCNTKVGHGADPGYLTVSQQVTLIMNPVVGCRYFAPGPRNYFGDIEHVGKYSRAAVSL